MQVSRRSQQKRATLHAERGKNIFYLKILLTSILNCANWTTSRGNLWSQLLRWLTADAIVAILLGINAKWFQTIAVWKSDQVKSSKIFTHPSTSCPCGHALPPKPPPMGDGNPPPPHCPASLPSPLPCWPWQRDVKRISYPIDLQQTPLMHVSRGSTHIESLLHAKKYKGTFTIWLVI